MPSLGAAQQQEAHEIEVTTGPLQLLPQPEQSARWTCRSRVRCAARVRKARCLKRQLSNSAGNAACADPVSDGLLAMMTVLQRVGAPRAGRGVFRAIMLRCAVF